MNQDQPQAPTSTKQQVVDALKKANNVLITVSQSPTIDQLASCIGLALILNKMNKHATAIFSGTVPSTIEFLQPEKLLETNTDSLRDFIISLDRNKADKLRYKIEDNVVRIFITPYRSSINQNDLEFTQGDFNVDAVVALGVDQREHLDLAIMQQGRILHDAVVMGVSAGANPSAVGSINWHESAASSICELVAGLSDALQEGLIDAQIATALLTGIVSETDRFRNDKTTAKVMSISAQLMASGANQQLVAKELDVKPVVAPDPQVVSADPAPVETMPIAATLDIPKEGEKVPKETAVSLHIDPNGPAPAVQLPGESADDEIKRIKIDEEGILHDDVQDQIINKPHKVIQPLEHDGQPHTSSYITSPPERGGTLTGAVDDNPANESPNPSMQAPPQKPLLSHDSPMETNPLVQQTSGTNQSPVSTETNMTLPHPESNAPETPPEPLSQPEANQAPAVEETNIDQEAARKAVLDAVASGPSILPPKPITALNAMPMDLGAAPQPQPSINAIAPPPLPPPIAPMPESPLVGNQPALPSEPTLPSPTPQLGNTPFNLPPPQQ